ncbi:MAG: type II CRISPR-associated endonuclease Cas1 [Chitinophagales bacterium]|jgi:CRISPR-associated protein Cas1|nr:type II CRISPR-associated endonuclease Cas1 [Sphingobacteriales bacterium]
MIKRTLSFGNPAYLSMENNQLVISKKNDELKKSVPIEDIGILILEHPQITITHVLIARLLENNVAIITSNEKYMPVGLMLNLNGHTLQRRYFENQITAKEPLKKQLWQHTIRCKIKNQANLLKGQGKGYNYLYELSAKVKSGDSQNLEAIAASYYWKSLFMEWGKFSRDADGTSPNHLLNYGYTILRAIVARSLVGSGLLPTLGIFHRNQYNAYCLADDIMEPYRPYVDDIVYRLCIEYGSELDLTTQIKVKLLEIATIDTVIGGTRSPLFNAIQRSTASLARSFESGVCELIYPEI